LGASLSVLSLLGSHPSLAQGPIKPPPDHDVRRLGTEPDPPAPPSVPPEEIIRRFSQKEDLYTSSRLLYGYRKTVRIEEFGPDGKPVGEFRLVSEVTRDPDGRVVNKVLEHPQSTLLSFHVEAEDVKELDRIPPFPLATAQLANYQLKYIGKEQIDEVDCYIFQVKPKAVERARALFDGIVWVDTQYLEVVKTYGRWLTDQGDVHSQSLPFATFDTYRENVDGKYWFPNYERSDTTLHLKDHEIPIRLVIKWSDFKLLPAEAPAPPPPKPQS
jgi:hypothetical protein